MGVRIIHDTKNDVACLYDSVSDVAFGPVFYGLDESEAGEPVDELEMAEGFRAWLRADARTYSAAELSSEYNTFRELIEREGWQVVAERVA